MAVVVENIFLNEDGNKNNLREKFGKRALDLIERFDSVFSTGSKGKLLLHIPGRVNLIGEHIDYCGYAVLPMAIEQVNKTKSRLC